MKIKGGVWWLTKTGQRRRERVDATKRLRERDEEGVKEFRGGEGEDD